jgi:hypothetical protein
MKKILLSFLLVLISIFGHSQEIEKTSVPVRLTLKDTTPPKVSLVYKNNGVANSNGKVEAVISVSDLSFISAVSINNEAQAITVKKDSMTFSKEFLPGQEVSVVASDQYNNVKERSLIIKGELPKLVANNTETKRLNYLLLIAEQDYTDTGISPLSEPLKDAQLLKDLLLAQYTFEEKNTTLLKNPTYEEIDTEFERLSREVRPEDNLLIFYAGHGFFDEKSNIGYWLPSDAQAKNRARWFRNSALVENIGAINSKHTLLIADACFSGGIFKTRAPFDNASLDIANMIKRPSRKAMTSGSLTTVPDKSKFMKYLLKTLSTNENKYLPSEDLFDEIRLAMKSNSDTKPLYGEIKDVGDEGGNFVFVRRE